MWLRLGAVVVAERGRRSLRSNSDLVGLLASAVRQLDDPAGPHHVLGVDAIRIHLLSEDKLLVRCVMDVLERLVFSSSCAVCDRQFATATIRSLASSLEECDPELVAAWRFRRMPSLFPLMRDSQQQWCVRDVSGSSIDLLSCATRSLQTRVVVKRQRIMRELVGPWQSLKTPEARLPRAAEPVGTTVDLPVHP